MKILWEKAQKLFASMHYKYDQSWLYFLCRIERDLRMCILNKILEIVLKNEAIISF